MTQSRFLMTQTEKPFENIVGKGENGGFQHFLISSRCFLTLPKVIFDFSVTLLSASAFNLETPKILSFGEEFNRNCL